MNEVAGIRKRLRKAAGQPIPEKIWEDRDIRDMVREYLAAKSDEEGSDLWGVLEDAVKRALHFWNGGREEEREKGLKGVQSNVRGGSRDMREAEDRDLGERISLDPRELVGDRTGAMARAMTALFALIGDQIPEVKEFREGVLRGERLSADKAHAFLSSHAARTFSRQWFKEWKIPFVDHRTEVLDIGPRDGNFNPVDDSMTLYVDPPGVTKTVRYAYPREGEANTRCSVQSGALMPIYASFPIESHGGYAYPSWLWPGSVVDELYDLSVELAEAFDWPLASANVPGGIRPRSESAAWFVLTGEAPQVRPLKAVWDAKHGSKHLVPQWRIQLEVPPWLPEEEVLRAIRTLKRQRPKGRQMPKVEKTLEVARFVWERERVDGYSEPPPWTKWVEQWNIEYPGLRIKSASDFRMYFLRADAAVKHLNFDPPNLP
jgi:hypothetical protein